MPAIMSARLAFIPGSPVRRGACFVSCVLTRATLGGLWMVASAAGFASSSVAACGSGDHGSGWFAGECFGVAVDRRELVSDVIVLIEFGLFAITVALDLSTEAASCHSLSSSTPLPPSKSSFC